jgi:hypothetical protein
MRSKIAADTVRRLVRQIMTVTCSTDQLQSNNGQNKPME